MFYTFPIMLWTSKITCIHKNIVKEFGESYTFSRKILSTEIFGPPQLTLKNTTIQHKQSYIKLLTKYYELVWPLEVLLIIYQFLPKSEKQQTFHKNDSEYHIFIIINTSCS